ncbi:hypothetical protein QEZ54_17810 [Catellatospora sp. KI3]|uniref:hypothetical protein n=1 Tax=Catellatospora sp. KI3 TaxID=3041620 RepID=UPI002482CD1B|nr:hypothetical protein [Catellatospora sp. KI3]MDI1462835.1 hypothetical protein [Catellatospora sp. KI3]
MFARVNGARDGALGLHCPVSDHRRLSLAQRRFGLGLREIPAGPSNEVVGTAWTPFVGERHSVAYATSSQMLSWLTEQSRPLVLRLYAHAQTLVYEHARPDGASAAARGRFNAALTDWRSRVQGCRERAEAAVKHADLYVDWYWQALMRNHLSRVADRWRCQGLRPPRAVLEPVWTKPGTYFLLRFGLDDDEASSKAARIFLQALDIIGEPLDHRPTPDEPEGGTPLSSDDERR